MAYDYKKEEKHLYKPGRKPSIIEVPAMKFMTITGHGNPNEEGGAYQKAIEILYPVAYTLKMSYKNNFPIPGYFEYVVPPLEGYWWIPGMKGMDAGKKDELHWISLLRLPGFIEKEHFQWACDQVKMKKKLDTDLLEYRIIEEGLCVQIMHYGAYDDEVESVQLMEDFIHHSNYDFDFSDQRMHHEIYLTRPNPENPEKMRTIIRHPIKLI